MENRHHLMFETYEEGKLTLNWLRVLAISLSSYSRGKKQTIARSVHQEHRGQKTSRLGAFLSQVLLQYPTHFSDCMAFISRCYRTLWPT